MKIYKPLIASLLTFLLAVPLLSPKDLTTFLAILFALFLRLFFFYSGYRALQRNSGFAADLLELIPKQALVYIDNDIESLSDISAVREGHIIRMQGQEIIPVDGFITFGSGFVDESALTGNTAPVLKSMGSPVFAGTKSMGGALLVRAERVNQGTYLFQMAQQLKAAPQYSYAIDLLFLALLGFAYATQSPYFLFFSPASFACAILWRLDLSFRARASALGCVWKEKVSSLFQANVLITGKDTLIEKKVRLTDIMGLQLSEDGALRLFGPLARRVENEPAFAILQEIKTRNIPLEILEVYIEHPEGSGGVLAGDQLSWIENPKEIPAELKAFCEERNLNGERLVFLELNGKISAVAAFEESIKKGSKETIQTLKELGFDFILTHPNKISVKKLAEELGISHVSDLNETLFTSLENEGLIPLWFGKEAKLNSVRYGVFENCEASVLEGNLASLLDAIQLARTYLRYRKIVFFGAILFPILGIFAAKLGAISCLFALLFLPLSFLPAKMFSLRLNPTPSV